ncbi:DUF4342 domain-containing protein [Nonomuraea sp. NPDC049421]|uniref:DUF4342 domain-containing protein n=1 Tax=Nonomuraea sp. NPDC049421 TaxID=3155275 RepID=UPI003447795C
MNITEEERVRTFAGTLKTLLHEGNVRRIVVKDAYGRTVMDVPLAAGAVAFVAAPLVTVVAGLTAVAAGWTIDVQRPGQDPGPAAAVRDDESATPAVWAPRWCGAPTGMAEGGRVRDVRRYREAPARAMLRSGALAEKR